jgi:Ni,Fe-hydrogenase III large subunit
MNWAKIKNDQTIRSKEIPLVQDMSLLKEEIVKGHKRVVGFLGHDEGERIRLYVIMADDAASDLLVSSLYLQKGQTYDSLTKYVPSFHMFERELHEDFGVNPEGHPWLKPVRKRMDNYPFFKMDGEEVHEVAVGPIHAGIIEPGHFRFMCNGEKVYWLEIQLGYQHRDVENIFVRNNNCFNSHLAGTIVGDTVIGHTLAYAKAMESLQGCKISERAEMIRTIALEMERVAVHIGDLGAICGDVAYLMGSSVFGATRTLVINSMLSICGSRFGKGLVEVGGVNFDINNELADKVNKTLDKVYKDVERMAETMFSAPSVLSRLERTGVVGKNIALEIGMVGLTARASGIELDIRADHPWGYYRDLSIKKEVLKNGDVFSRTYLRYVEIKRSIIIIKELLQKLKGHENEEVFVDPKGPLREESMVVSMVEGWRGEIVHVALTNSNGGLSRYKIKDPSFNNWYGLGIAERNNGISDFPLCNKSFNLSYCGNDL